MPASDSHPSWSRFLPLSGVAFAGLMVAGAAAFPMPPGGEDSPASKPDWLASHYNAVIAQSYVRALAALAFIALAVAVSRTIRRVADDGSPLPNAALLGGAFSGALVLAAQATTLAAALFVHSGGSADAVRALGSLQGGFLDMSAIPALLLFAAVGISATRGGVLPRWLTAFTIAGVPIALVDAFSYDGGPLEAVGMVGLLYFLAWSLLVGMRLFSSERGDRVGVGTRRALVH